MCWTETLAVNGRQGHKKLSQWKKETIINYRESQRRFSWSTLDRPSRNNIYTARKNVNTEYWLHAEAEAPILWPPDAKSRLTGKNPDAGKDSGQEEKRATEDEMVREHHWLNGHEFEQTPGDSEGQGSLACCGPGGHKELDTTEQLNNVNKLNRTLCLVT